MDSDRRPKTITEFCEAKRFSRSHYYNLRKIGRGPKETWTGGVVTISPADERDWDKAIAEPPILGGLRVAAEKARAEATA